MVWDGGVDLAIINFFGIGLMDRVQTMVIDEFFGEQPIGTSIIVETGRPKHPYLAHTPTMRIPMSIATTDNVYAAMWAFLVAIARQNKHEVRKIDIIACSGLGTATGQMPAAEVARQRSIAYLVLLRVSRTHKNLWDGER
jgi:O-acetyl-ADP-ribose deacetylase (regulator of RNase III)